MVDPKAGEVNGRTRHFDLTARCCIRCDAPNTSFLLAP